MEITLSLLCYTLAIASATPPRYHSLTTAYKSFSFTSNFSKTARNSLTRRMLPDSNADMTEDLKNTTYSNRRSLYIDDDEAFLAVKVDWNFPVKKQHEPADEQDFCGESNFNGLSRIIGGHAAASGNWPWTVALGYEKPEGHDVMYRCGGTLITAIHVLTAAHCVHSHIPKFVLMGVVDLQDSKSGHIELISKTLVHEGYKEANNANDIAILLLEKPVHFSDTMRPACLPLSAAVRNSNYISSLAYVAGWGTRSFNESSSRFLQWAGINVVNRTMCQEAYKELKRAVDTRMICAAHSEWKKDACQGDSGGPLVWSYESSFYLIGIVSYGNGCARENYPGVYVRVANYTKWIQNSIETLQWD